MVQKAYCNSTLHLVQWYNKPTAMVLCALHNKLCISCFVENMRFCLAVP